MTRLFSHPRMTVHHRHLIRWIAGLIVAGAFTVQCIGAWQDSQTTDEGAHLAAGRSYWQTGDYRLNPEHPPFIKYLAAAPLLLIPSTRVDTTSWYWAERDEWHLGQLLLYDHRAEIGGARVIMFVARLPMIGLWLLLLWLVWSWATQRWGGLAGLTSLLVVAFDPNLLGHGHLVTTDVGLTLGFLATIWALDRFLRQPRWRTLLLVSIIFALTQVTKFSAIILWLIVPLLAAIRLTYRPATMNWAWWGRLVGGLVVVTGLITWMVYGFQVMRPNQDPVVAQLWSQRQTILNEGWYDQQPPLMQRLIDWSAPQSTFGRLLEGVARTPIPAYSYWRGVFSTLAHDLYGHPAYLLGHSSDLGWWYYFPVAIAVKTPWPALVLFLVVIGSGIRRLVQRGQSLARRWPFDAWLLTLPPLLFFGWSLTSHIDIGVRHVFPVTVWLLFSVGSLIPRWPWRPRFFLILTVLLAGLAPVFAVAAWPNTIGYYSGAIGGTTQGYRYVIDSNLDWNQDVWRLDAFLRQQRFSEVHLVLFGSLPYAQLWPTTMPVWTDEQIAAGLRPSGVVVISAGQLYNLGGPFGWLRGYRPKWRIGSSITVYDFR